ncbi:hypothetical protein GB937_005234 [Aspergillus fischeri]|nr:hypothetical protein GB937_005234 [Aspergillus fischeri]
MLLLAMEPKQASFYINSCPADILYLVFQFLSSAELHALYLVNKMCRTIAEKFFYSKIQMTWLKADPAYIITVHLDGNLYDHWSFHFKIPKLPVSGAELDQLIAFIWGTGAPYSDL